MKARQPALGRTLLAILFFPVLLLIGWREQL